ncbi:MAG: NAD(P)-dependent oxidoreductase [Chitinophagaceae bacterium]
MSTDIKQKKILVTGGSGFIGTNLVTHLVNKGYVVCNLDRNPPKIAEHKTYWQQVDLLDINRLAKAVRMFEPDWVVHLAARTDLNGDTLEDYAVNTGGTKNLIEALDTCSPQHVLFTSSMLVCEPGYIPIHNTDFSPATVYGESKVQMEEIIRTADLSYRWNIIRPTSIWGPWFGTPYKDFFDRVLAGKMFHIGGVEAATKTYGFVLNAVYQILSILIAEKPSKEVFYIGDNPPLNIRSWANQISEQLGNPSPSVIPFPVIKLAAIFGDLITKAGGHFPMTNFRLKNMTTNNILPLGNLEEIAGENPYGLSEAIDITLAWMKKNNQ